MAAVQVQVNVLARAEDPTQHNLTVEVPAVFQLSTTDTTYATDLTAFGTTVYNYYNSALGGSATPNLTFNNAELRWKAWVGGGTGGGGTTTNDGVFLNQTPASGTDIVNELTGHIQRVLTGDQLTPGQ